MVDRFIGSGRFKEGGFLATHKQDFNSHVDGGDFRHTANNINMDPIITAYGGFFNGTTVQDTLDKIASFTFSSGQGFVTIGDGYDTANPPNYIVGSNPTPTLNNAFTEAFNNPRLRQGGIILVKAGTYKLNNVVIVPPGITIMGEGRGTIIIGHTSEQPMFLIKQSTEFPSVGSTTPISSFNSIDQNKIIDLILGDNTDNYITSGGSPIPTMTTVPMILMETGANLSCERVTFLGKYNIDSVLSPKPASYAVIGTTVGSTNGTYLKLNNCYIDGFGIGIEFTPSGLNYGDTNHLIIENCRARIFGKNNTDPENNCLAYFTTSNASFTNNYILFNDVTPGNPICFVKNTNSLLNKIPKVIILNNYGGRISGLQNVNIFYDYDVVNADAEFVITGNTISNLAQNQWYLTIGGGYLSTAYGDINGINAVDFAIQYMQGYYTTVYINAGSYDVKLTDNPGSSNDRKFKLIGIKNGNLYPTLKLDLDSGCFNDNYSLKTLYLVDELKSIQFISTNSAAPNYCSITLMYTDTINTANGQIKVEDCSFTDVLLQVYDVGSGSIDPITSKSTSNSISINNCQFLQSYDFSNDYLSLVLPQADIVTVKDCTFRGAGYVGGIGDISTGCQDNPSKVTIENCTMDATNFFFNSIRTTSPANRNNYFIINGTQIDLKIKNCNITANSYLNFTNYTIDSTLLSSALVQSYIDITANSVSIENSLFNGPEQTFTEYGVNFALPTVKINANYSLFIDKCKFMGGALPLQIIGFDSTFLTKGTACKIINSSFRGDNDGKSLCLLHFDVGAYNSINKDNYEISLIIDNCEFNSLNTDGPAYPPKDYNNNYLAGACLALYAYGWNVSLSNNIIKSYAMPTDRSYIINNASALYINTYTAPYTGGSDGIAPAKILLNNNQISLQNGYDFNGIDTDKNTDLVFTCYLKSNIINVNNNTIEMNNYLTNYDYPTSATYNYAGHLYLDAKNLLSTSLDNSSCLVSNNIFLKNFDGFNNSILKHNSIYVESTYDTTKGLIVDNIFSSPYLNSLSFPAPGGIDNPSNTDLIYINNFLTEWTAERNKNQTLSSTIPFAGNIIRGTYKDMGFGNYYSGNDISGNDIIKTTLSSAPFTVVQINSAIQPSLTETNSSAGLSVYFNQATYSLNPSYEHYLEWRIPLMEIIPYGSYIFDIQTSAQASSAIAGGESIDVELSLIDKSTSGIDYASVSLTSTAATPISLTSLSKKYIANNNQSMLKIYINFDITTTNILTLDPITIKYRW